MILTASGFRYEDGSDTDEIGLQYGDDCCTRVVGPNPFGWVAKSLSGTILLTDIVGECRPWPFRKEVAELKYPCWKMFDEIEDFINKLDEADTSNRSLKEQIETSKRTVTARNRMIKNLRGIIKAMNSRTQAQA